MSEAAGDERRIGGGCLCGAIRYEVDLPEFDSGYCHCSICRRSSGAPVIAWANVEPSSFRVIKGTPKRYRSSPTGERAFCPDCGSQLFFVPSDPSRHLSFMLATLDDPTAILARLHIHSRDRLPWFDTLDDLPRYHDEPLPHPWKR
jgi:hypothetical protein